MDIHEGEREPTDISFQRIGVPIPVTSTQHNFDTHSAPLQALAVSNKFGLTVVAHPQGFCVARTSELLRLAENNKDKEKRESTVHDASIANVQLAGVSILALSSDDLTLAACVGGTVNFFSVPDLVYKGNLKPFQSILICETQYTKEFIWCTAKENAYLALSCEGMLTCGEIESSLKHKEEKVIAVDWSADGRHFAVLTYDKKLSILSSDFQKKSQLPLPTKLQASSADNDIKMHVDSLKWIRRDCIVIGCVGVNEEEEECEYPVYILTSSSGDISQDLTGAEVLAFDCLFSTINGSILPPNNGPYLLLSCLDFWDLAVVANRRNIDDHIVLLGWVLDDGKKVAWLEILDEKWLPRIELQENGDDNFVVGIAMDRTSTDFQISIPTADEGMKKLPPCPLLLCMTIEGKLNLFSVARIAEESHVSQVVVAPTTVPANHALMARLKENFEFQKSSLSESDSKILEPKENVKAMASQAVKPESKMLNMEDSKAFDLQKAYNEPVPSEKSSFTTLLPKVDVNSKIFHVTKHDNFSVDQNKTESRQSIKNSFGTFSSGSTSRLQSAPKSSLAEGFSSSFPGSSTSVLTKTVSHDEGFHKVSSFSTQPASGTVFSNMSKFNTQTVTSKADVSGSFDKDVAGKGSSRNTFENLSKASFGAAPFGSRQSSGGLLSSSMSASNPSSVSASSAVGALVTEIKDSYQGNTSFPGAVAAFRSANVMTTTDSTSISQSGTKTFTFSTSASEGSLHAMVQSKQSSESLVPVSAQKSSRRTSGMSEIEADFSRELEEVRSMAKEVDDLMLTIEGNKIRPNSMAFSKHAVLSVENRIKKLTENCNVFKERLEDQVFDIQHIRDKLMQVDAWRIYMQSVIKQAADQQYQDLRNRQKLDPELDRKQQSITKGEERLKQQILDLERHLQNLEISKFGVNNHPRRAQQKKIENTRQQQHLQNLYNTVNSQLEVAEKLAACLSKQMEALHISPDKSAKSKNTIKESLFKSIGLSPSEASFLSPNLKEKSSNLNSLHKFANSPSYSASKESPIRKESIVQEQDSMRRRRNPIDSEWANVGTVKTTVKRASLASSSRANRSKLSESEISQLRTSSEMFGHDGSMSPMYRSHISEVKGNYKEPSKSIGLNISRNATAGLNISSNATAGTSTGHSPESVYKSSQAPTDSLKSEAADSRYRLQSPHLVEDRRQQKHGSDLMHNSSAFSSHPKARTPNSIPTSPFKVTVGSQCDSLIGLTPSTMRSIFEPIPEASFGFPKAKTSTDIVPEESISSIFNTTKVLQQLHEPGSAQIKSLFSSGRVAESNSGASAVLPSKLATSSQASSLTTLLKSTSSNAEGPGYASEVGSTSPVMQSGKPFVFSKATSNATVSQSAKASSESSLSYVEAKSSFIASSGPEVKSIFPQGMSLFGSKTQNDFVAEAASQPKPLFGMLSLATSTGQTIATTSGDESRISAPQVSSLFDSKPQNADATVTTSLPKPFSFSMSSFAASSGPNMATTSGHESRTSTPQDPSLFGSKPEQIMACGAASQPMSVFPSLSSVSSAQTRNSLSAVTSSPINLSTTAQVSSLGGSASSDQSKPGLTHPPQLGLSSLGTSPSNQISSFSSVSTISSLAPTSVSLASPFPSSSSQPKPLFEGFSTSSAVTSVPAFSFSTAPEAVFGQDSSHASGTSGFGQFSASLSGTSVFGIQTSAVSSSSTSFGFSNSSSVQMAQTHGAPSFAQNVATISSVMGSSSLMPSPVLNEEDMEEEASSQPSDANIGGFSGFGLGSATPSNPKSNPFGQALINSQPNNAFSLSVPQSELFKPASFTIPAAQSSPQLTPTFSSSFGRGGGIGPSPVTGSAFGQPAHPGPGQQALGSALGTFGQSRQIGLGGHFVAGFGSPNPLSGSGFKTTSVGGFSGAAGGGGFAAAATSGGGFAAAATSGGGFAAAANAASGGFSGFQAFSGNQGSTGFSSLGGLSGSPNAPQSLITQMRK